LIGFCQCDWDQKQVKEPSRRDQHCKILCLDLFIGLEAKIDHKTVGCVKVHWTTHKPPGLSEKDTFMARYCDDVAKEIGTVEKGDAQSCARPQ
jgi:4a-hydroxytetrahydrobiopterin dehydratase